MYCASDSASPEWVANAPNKSGRSIDVIIAPSPPLDLPPIARWLRSAMVRCRASTQRTTSSHRYE